MCLHSLISTVTLYVHCCCGADPRTIILSLLDCSSNFQDYKNKCSQILSIWLFRNGVVLTCMHILTIDRKSFNIFTRLWNLLYGLLGLKIPFYTDIAFIVLKLIVSIKSLHTLILLITLKKKQF